MKTITLAAAAMLLAGLSAAAQESRMVSPASSGLSEPNAPPRVPSPPALNAAPPSPSEDPVQAPQPPRPPTVSGPRAQTMGGAGYGTGIGGAMAIPSSRTGFQDRLQAILARPDSAPAGALLVLSSELDPTAGAKLEEDMSVMALILQRACGEAGIGSADKAMGVNLFFASGGEAPQNLYIQGYGAVFMLKAPFPLLPPVAPEEPAGQEAEPESEWEQARRELLGQPLESQTVPGSAEPYRGEKVHRLKQVILEALKNAGHIRELKSRDSVTICVIGASEPHVQRPRPGAMAGSRPLPGAPRLVEPLPSRGEDASVLTLSATKGDIDSFAKGSIDLDAFRKAVKTAAYWTRTSRGPAGYGGYGAGFGGFVR